MSGDRGFVLRERLGEGGFGVVFRAHQPELDRDVAVKMVHPSVAAQTGFSGTFQEEARVVARLEHPHIVPLYGFGYDDEGVWLVMRLLRGGSLAEALGRGPWRPQAAARLLEQVAGGLAVAHRHGVIHRDVKPGNILLDSQGAGYLADFGIAFDAFSFEPTADEAPGSPMYMAPEQLRGEPVSEATDVYSLGLVMFEILTGDLPWKGAALADVVSRQLDEPLPDLVTVRPDLPSDLGAVLQRATAKNPTDRTSLDDFVAAFTAAAIPPGAAGPQPATARSMTQVPAATGVVVGRDREISEVLDRLNNDRLVTLTGVAGVGKTTVALEAARRSQDGYRDGVFVVDLSSVSDPDRVGDAVATALGIEGNAGEPAAAIQTTLRTRSVLLVLDNCEQFTEGVATLAQRVIDAAPEVRLVSTSRERLDVPGEVAIEIAPLEGPPESLHELNRLLDYPAVSLFEHKAQAARAAFVVDEVNAGAVAAICRHLDGIPLAIELAAARTRVLTPQQIAQRLDDRFALLTGGRRGGAARQRTLEAAIDWSYQLLDEPEQLLFERMSVFHEGCTLDAAEAVCSGSGVEANDVLDLVERLVDKSLLTTTVTAEQLRYGMLETIHQYATGRLASRGHAEVWAERHAHHYAIVAETARGAPDPDESIPVLRFARGAVQTVSLLPALRADHANLIAAMTTLYDADDYRSSGDMAGALYPYWLYTGRSQEASLWYERLIDLHFDWTPQTWGELLQGAGTFRLFRDPADAEGLAWLEEALRIRTKRGLYVGNTLTNLGDAAMRRGDLDAAAVHLDRLATWDRSSRPTRDYHYVYSNLAEVAFLAGRPEEAATYFEASHEADGGQVPERQDVLQVFLAGLERWEGHLEAARNRIESWQDTVKGVYARTDTEAVFDIQMAALERDEGHSERAEPYLIRAAELVIPKGWWLEGLLALWATVSAAQGRNGRAALLLGAAEVGGRYLYLPMHHPDEIEPYRTSIQQAHGGDYDRLHLKGAAMSIPDAIAYAQTASDQP